jgi:parallel beta-helix repeat protein
MNVYKRVSNVTLTKSTIEYNGSCGVVTTGCSYIKLVGNTVRYNSATGVFFQDGTLNSSISGDLSYGNYTRLGIKVRTPFTLTGWASKVERDILLRGTLTGTAVLTNNYQ